MGGHRPSGLVFSPWGQFWTQIKRLFSGRDQLQVGDADWCGLWQGLCAGVLWRRGELLALAADLPLLESQVDITGYQTNGMANSSFI